MFDFSDSVVVVTGAAGNLGLAVTQKFLAAGATVCAVDHKQNRLSQLIASNSFSGKLICYDGVNLTDAAQTLSLAERVQNDGGVPDVLVNVVGGFTYGETVHALSDQTWQRMFELNVQTVINSARAFIPEMIAQNHGKVINVASRSGLKAGAKTSAYASAKSVVIRLTESMSAELMADNIQVNCVLPGIIDTPQNRASMPNADFDRWVLPEKIADPILFLASEGAQAISGAAIPVYGRS